MWDVLDYTCPKSSSGRPGRGLFHSSFCQDANEEETEHQTVETQIFHNPIAEVDTSNGGQAQPPYSNTPSNRTLRGAYGRLGPPPTVGGGQQQQQQHNPQTAPWPTPGIMETGSFMDMTYDPFFQFHDQGSPYLGLWEVGNL
jgi:hypothetical protein